MVQCREVAKTKVGERCLTCETRFRFDLNLGTEHKFHISSKKIVDQLEKANIVALEKSSGDGSTTPAEIEMHDNVKFCLPNNISSPQKW